MLHFSVFLTLIYSTHGQAALGLAVTVFEVSPCSTWCLKKCINSTIVKPKWFSDMWVPELLLPSKKLVGLAQKGLFLPQNMLSWAHMGQFVQGGKNGRLMSYLF